MPKQLEGRRVLVTGAATGIGAAAVEVFHRAGAIVAACHHQAPPPPAIADAATWWRCDATSKSEIDAAFERAAAEMGGIDVLLHCAGRWVPSTPDGLSEDDLDVLIATNVKSTVFANQAAFAHMRERGGAIINLGSSEGVTGNPHAASYSLTKSAVHGWTRAAARAWGAHGVTVNSLAPAVATPGYDRLKEHIGPDAVPFLEQQIAQAIVIGGALGDPVTDLGPMLAFLASTGARFITGQLLAVDGGAMMLGA